ncbi:MAG: peptidoglycan editing factor PgeF [Proteobacteria bacterium]|nr:peptidoglycan editing factor PgeF [Pseudomonadota bacterium]
MRGQGFRRGPPAHSHLMYPSSTIGAPHQSGLLWIRRSVSYFRHPGLSRYPQLVQGTFTRQGGVSNPPYDRLNTSYDVGDHPRNVTSNLAIIKRILGTRQLMHMDQAHGDRVHVVRPGNPRRKDEIPLADAIITNVPKIAILVKQADCQGIIIFDPKKGVVANVHCGWRGNVKNILGKVVTRMKHDFGCEGSDLLAAIGPSLGPCCAEFVGHGKIFPKGFEEFMVRTNYFNLWAISSRQLQNEGLRQENIEISGICTRCRTDLFYSYRGEGETGRFGTVVMLK